MRKFRKTEISRNVRIESNGQHMKANWFCINCHCLGSTEKHYPDCKNRESYAIPSTAEVPKKNASKRIWDIFKKQFVFANTQGWWNFKEHSYYFKNNNLKQQFKP